MRKPFGLIILIITVVTATLALHAQAENIYLMVDGTQYIPQYTQTTYGYEITDQVISGSGWQVNIKGTIDIDPVITHTINVTNSDSSPRTFEIVNQLQIANMPAGPTVITSSIEGSLTDLSNDSVSIEPGPNHTLISNNYLKQYLSEDPVHTWSVGPSATFGPGTAGIPNEYAYGPFDYSGAGPNGDFNDWYFGELTSFTLSGNDVAFLTSRCSIQSSPVPLPGSLLLLGTGLLGLGAAGWWRGRKG